MLEAHFLNVGKGSCTMVRFPSRRVAVIDIDNSRVNGKNNLTDPVAYYKAVFGRQSLFRFILTHPDMDHMSGLYARSREVALEHVWDTKHDKVIADSDWDSSPYDRRDWDTYQSFRSSSSNPKTLYLHQKATADCCWVQDCIQILSPTEELVGLANRTEEYNHLSYVLKFEYAGIKFLLGGDATTEVWDTLYSTCSVSDLKADIFVAPHHGSKNNVNKDVFTLIDPDYVIVSVADGVDYDYDYYSKLANEMVLTTKYYGTLRVEVRDTGNYDIFPERNA